MTKRLAILTLLLLPTACTISPPLPAPSRPMPVPKARQAPAPAAKSFPLPESPLPIPRPAPSPSQSVQPTPPVAAKEAISPAVIALMRQAESDRRQGNLDQAVARIERALRIQPQNAELWYTLANLRLEQHQPKLAEELAKKAISLAQGKQELLRRSWLLIAQARHQSGDVQGAQQAEQEARRY